MSRFVFATVPMTGHTVPALPIARALVDRGHSVRWHTGAAFADRVIQTGAVYVPMSEYDYSVDGMDDMFPERLQRKGIGRLRYDLANVFPATLRGQLRDLRALLADEPADVLVGDQGLLAGPILRELGGPPFAAFGITVVTYPDPDLAPFGLGLRPTSGRVGRVRNRMLTAAVRALLFRPVFHAVNEIRFEHGLSVADDIGMGYPAHADLFLQLATAGFEYPREVPEVVHYVGPTQPARTVGWVPPSWWPQLLSADKPVVLVTQGTVAVDGGELLRPTLDALADEDVLVVAVTGGPDPAEWGPLPANARVERFLPFDRLLPLVDIYVTNGGFGGVQLALSHGIPIVAAGKTEDKAEVSARVAHSGVGINLRTQHPRAGQIRAAVRQVLAEPRYAAAARRIQAEIGASGRQEHAAELLEQLALRRTPVTQDTPLLTTPS